MQRVDEQSRLIGLSIIGVSGLTKDHPLEAELAVKGASEKHMIARARS